MRYRPFRLALAGLLVLVATGLIYAAAACGEQPKQICTHPTAGVEHCVTVSDPP